MPATVTLSRVAKSFGPHVVLRDVSLVLAPGDRVGIVAPNGTGKSTLLRVIAGIEAVDSGAVRIDPPDATIGYLAQEAERRAGEAVREFLARRTGVAAATAEFEHAASALAGGGAGADDAYAAALDRYLALGAAEFDARVEEVCAEVGLPARVLDAPMTSLSGGEAARAALAAVLLARFDVFLLDEPTNDLDFAGLELLERVVLGWSAPSAIVSHDRAFLERTVDTVVEIDEHAHTVGEFHGGWLAYLDERATKRRHAEEDYAGYVERRDSLAAPRPARAAMGAPRGAARKQERREGQEHPRVPEGVERARRGSRQAHRDDGGTTRGRRQAMGRLGVAVRDRRGATFGKRRRRALPARSSSAAIAMASVDRRFGSGPSTSRSARASGSRWWGRTAAANRRCSPRCSVRSSCRPVRATSALASSSAHSHRRAGASPPRARATVSGDRAATRRCSTASSAPTGMLLADARSLLAKFGLGAEHVLRPADSLSPGERTRAELALLMATGVNTIVLDEPTNHLDMPAIDQLEQALASFDGTLVVVTHDRRLLDELTFTRSIELSGGRITRDGDV